MPTNIIIIDDDKIICKITKRMFQLSDLSKYPIVFNSAKSALQFLKQSNLKKQRNIIFLDINMPSINGWDFIHILEKEKIITDIEIYLITSSIDPEDHKRAKNNDQVLEILIKPITLAKTKELKTLIEAP